MSGSSVEFYADNKDLELLFSTFNESHDYKYIQCMSELNVENIQTNDCLELLNHLVSVDSPNQTGLFLCTKADTAIVPRPINMKTESGVKMRVDQVLNPDSAEILLGGQVDQDLIVNTTLRTTGETAVAKRVFKNLKKLLLKQSTKVKSFYVMPSALEKLEKGVRLAQGIDSHPDYDLKKN